MSWSRTADLSRQALTGVGRRAFLVLLLVSGCGFTPVLGTDSPARGLMGAVRMQTPASQADFDFVARLEERLGRSEAGIYELRFDIATEEDGVGITAEGATTRYVLFGSVDWTLVKADGGEVLGSGTVRNFVGWSATGSTVAGLAAEEDAQRRLMRLLADQVVAAVMTRLAAP